MQRTIAAIPAAVLLASCATLPPGSGSLSALPRVGEVDERFLSYNVEMVEVTGGRFWRPYGSSGSDRYEYGRRWTFQMPSYAGSPRHWARLMCA